MKNSLRYTSLDSLRGLAAFIVVIFHVMISYTILRVANYNYEFDNEFIKWITVSPLKIFWSGMEAVLLFFVLSGFVLSLPYWRNMKNQNYTAYLIKRFCRIYIPFIVVMLISVALVNLLHGYRNLEVIGTDVSNAYLNRWSEGSTWLDIISFIFMINLDNINNVNGVVWTLYHEIRISLLLPLFFIIMSKFKFIKSFIIVMGINFVAFVVMIFCAKTFTDDSLKFIFYDFSQTFYYCCFFLAGSFLAKNIDKFSFIKEKNRFVRMMFLVVSILLLNPNWISYSLNIKNMYIENFIALLGILGIFIITIYSQTVENFLNKKSLLWLGKVSFSLYMIHIPLIMLCTTFLTEYISLLGSFIVGIILSLVLSELCYRYLEEPSMKLGKKLSKRYLENQVNKKQEKISLKNSSL